MPVGTKRFAVVVACAVGLVLGACGGPPTEESQESLGVSQDEIIIGGGNQEVSQVFYSDGTYTVQVGWLLTKCNGSSTLQGTMTRWVKTATYSC